MRIASTPTTASVLDFAMVVEEKTDATSFQAFRPEPHRRLATAVRLSAQTQ